VKERTRTYSVAMTVNRPVAWWGRMQVEGLEALPEQGPLLILGNHDSHWDPVMVGIAAFKRRQIRALAKSELWDVRGLGPILNGMGQIPIQRGKGDKDALAKAIETLRAGACIGVFPEGTRSKGKVLRARSGFPRRPRIRLRFFDPAGGQPRPDEDPGALSARLLSEIRELVPPSISYRKRAKLSGVSED
jgi:1-acyl-sn-glycerol-3-phosphate acyltransferase